MGIVDMIKEKWIFIFKLQRAKCLPIDLNEIF